jgi:hypothetical protein
VYKNTRELTRQVVCNALCEVTSMHLNDTVIQGRLEARSGGLIDAVTDAHEIFAQAQLCSNICERVACRGGEKGGKSVRERGREGW